MKCLLLIAVCITVCQAYDYCEESGQRYPRGSYYSRQRDGDTYNCLCGAGCIISSRDAGYRCDRNGHVYRQGQTYYMGEYHCVCGISTCYPTSGLGSSRYCEVSGSQVREGDRYTRTENGRNYVCICGAGCVLGAGQGSGRFCRNGQVAEGEPYSMAQGGTAFNCLCGVSSCLSQPRSRSVASEVTGDQPEAKATEDATADQFK